MNNEILYELIIAIVNRGFADDVMSAAKSAGATGGTIMNARGTGKEEAKKFFGITIQEEKEVVMIIVDRNIKRQVMQNICKHAGLSTPGHGISFSLPIDQVVGLTQSEDHKRQ